MTSSIVRWLLVPWRDRVLLLALIGAAATPAFLTASADLWQAGAADEVSKMLIADGPASDLELSVRSNTFFTPNASDEADREVTERLDEIARLGEVRRTLATSRGPVAPGSSADAFPVPARFVHHAGAIQTIDYVRHLPDEFEGAWISEWYATRFNLELGDTLTFFSSLEPEAPGAELAPGGGPTASVLVVGIYETLWTEDGSAPESDRGIDFDAFLTSLPPELVPRYLGPFQAPSFALIFIDERPMEQLGVGGSVRWAASLEDEPSTFDDLTATVLEISSLERSLARDPGIRTSLDALAGDGVASPLVESTLPETLQRVNDRIAALNRPLRSTEIAGAFVGVLVMVATAIYSVSRRSQEFRLLAAEGDRFEHFVLRAAAQLVGPVALGSGVGIGLAAVAGAAAGPSAPSIDVRTALETITLWRAAAVCGVGWLVAALAIGVLGHRAVDGPLVESGTMRVTGSAGSRRLIPVVIGLAMTAAVWFEAADAAERGTFTLLLVVLPILALATAAGAALYVVELLMRRGRLPVAQRPGRDGYPESGDPERSNTSTPKSRTVLFLAGRRATRTTAPSRMVVVALSVSLGLLGLSTVIVSVLDDTTDDALFSELGGETLVDLVGKPQPDIVLPARTTVAGFEDTTALPGERRVRVVAIDPSQASEALRWPADAALSFAEVEALIESDLGPDIAAIAIGGQGLPTTGNFRIDDPFPYQVVGRTETLPLASPARPTLLISVNRLDAIADINGVAVPPSQGLRQNLISAQPRVVIDEFLAGEQIRFRSIASRQDRLASVDFIAPAYAFGYLRWLGIVGAAVATASLLLYAASQRSRRELASVITGRMGLSRSGLALVTTVEVAALTLIALVAASVAVPTVIARVLPTFDPAPDLPPVIDVDVPWLTAIMAIVSVLAGVSAVVWIAERSVRRRSDGVVLRESA